METSRRGITLFETVAALAIVGVTAVSALSAVGAEMRTAERARRAIEAEALAVSKMDFLGLLTDQELQSLPDSVKEGKFEEPLDEYTWTTTSKALSDQAGVYDIAITISWPDKHSWTVHTYQYRRPQLAPTR